MISVERTKLKNVLVFRHFAHEDHRGTYEELYNERDYSEIIEKETGWKPKWQEDDIAKSFKHVLRGFHGDDRTWKLLTCIEGRSYFVVLNFDKDDPDFGKWQSFSLSEENKKQILIPPKYGNAHVTMSDKAILLYKQSKIYRGMKNQFTVKYKDPRFNVWWPVKDNLILSERDEKGSVPDDK